MAATDPKPEPQYGHVPITEEFDDAKHTLPPIAPVVIALVAVAIVLGALTLLLKKPVSSTGSINDVFAVQVAKQETVLCSIQLTIHNNTDKVMVVRGLSATLHTFDQKDLDDTAAPASDVERYIQAVPELKGHVQELIRADMQIAAGQSMTGSFVVAFPVTKEQFDQRRGISATVDLYDHNPLKLNK